VQEVESGEWQDLLRAKTNSFVFNKMRPSASINKNVFPPNFDWIAINPHSGVLLYLPRRDIILPAVPGARYKITLHDSLAKWSSSVQAGIVDGKELTAKIGQRNSLPFHLKFAD
jgi:hypothetical protein